MIVGVGQLRGGNHGQLGCCIVVWSAIDDGALIRVQKRAASSIE
jgi:hypothetical protein